MRAQRAAHRLSRRDLSFNKAALAAEVTEDNPRRASEAIEALNLNIHVTLYVTRGPLSIIGPGRNGLPMQILRFQQSTSRIQYGGSRVKYH